jgi:NAD(P)-dependent dehydrogenase (short-subunit alcohol dehydrogenase family)
VRVLVTGGASGLGRAFVLALAEGGASVMAADLNEAGLEQTAALASGDVKTTLCDVSDEAACDAAVEATVSALGGLDALVNNAGIVAVTRAPAREISVEEFDRVMAVNVRGIFLGLRAAFRQYARQGGGGSIVTTASICSFGGGADLVAYHTSKHAILGLMRSAAVYGGPLGIRVNAVAPGIVPTNLLGRPAESSAGESGTSARAKLAPLGRAGTTEEIAAVVAFLLGDEASFVTGDTYSVDGGAVAVNPVRPYSP